PGGSSSSLGADDSAEPTIAEEVTTALEERGETDFWVRFADRPDLSSFAQLADWQERGQAVYDALTDSAEASQQGIREQLEAEGVDYEAFWATNAIRVQAGDSA